MRTIVRNNDMVSIINIWVKQLDPDKILEEKSSNIKRKIRDKVIRKKLTDLIIKKLFKGR